MTVDVVLLCVESLHPAPTGRCDTHGVPCTTALYVRVEGTTDTAADRLSAAERT